MTVPQCVDAPDDGPARGAKRWHVIVVVVSVTVIVLVRPGVSPEWFAAAAALIGAVAGPTRRS